MKKTETIALRLLLLFCLSSFIQGQKDSTSDGPNQNNTIPSTASSPQTSSTANSESLLRPTLPTTFSRGDGKNVTDTSANETLNQMDTETANNTAAPGFPTRSAGPTVNTLAHLNSSSVSGNLTYIQDADNPSNGDNQTSTASNTTVSTTNATTTTTTTTALPSSAPSTHSQTPSASTRPQNTTKLPATITPSRDKSSTVTSSTTAQTKSSMTTVLPAKFSSAPVPPGTPSELNVGDDTASSNTSMDPLLAGLVSVFVVTAAVVSLLIFLKLRHRNERPEFRRLQDLPMDDMMEDTPLSMYSY